MLCFYVGDESSAFSAIYVVVSYYLKRLPLFDLRDNWSDRQVFSAFR